MESEPLRTGSGKRPKNSHGKRREKAPQCLHEKQNHVLEESGDESEGVSPPRLDRAKVKSPKGRRTASPLMLEDIIDGFAISSFKSLEDLENHIKATAPKKEVKTPVVTSTITKVPTPPPQPCAVGTDTTLITTATLALTAVSVPLTVPLSVPLPTSELRVIETVPAHPPSPAETVSRPPSPPKVVDKTDKPKKEFLKKVRKSIDKVEAIFTENNKIVQRIPSPTPYINSDSHIKSNDVDSILRKSPLPITLPCNNKENIDRQLDLREDKEKHNGSLPPSSGASTASDRSHSRDRFSEASTLSSINSGRGYSCDSESEPESLSKASDAGSEPLFTTKHNTPPPTEITKTLDNCIPHLNNIASTPVRLSQPSPAPALATTTTASISIQSTTTTTSVATSTTTRTTPAKPLSPVTTPTAHKSLSSASSLTSLSLSSLSSSSSSRRQSSPHTNAHFRTQSPRVPPTHPTRARSLTPQQSQHKQHHHPTSSIIREPPRPIPGLSGTRPEDREPDRRTTPSHFIKSTNWTPVAPNSIHHSGPHISPGPPSLPLSSLTHRSRTPSTSLHPAALPPIHHTQHPPHSLPPHSMFTALAPHQSHTAGPLPFPGGVAQLGASETISTFANHQELARVQHELNERFLRDRGLDERFIRERGLDRSFVPAGYTHSPYLRAEMHQHQHTHQHQHMHQHIGGYPPPLGSTIIPPAAPPPLLPGLPAGYPGVSPMMHHPGIHGAPAPLGSGLGAFQPKINNGPTGMHPAQILISIRDREKSVASQGPAVTPIKKNGKWCAAHVRIAWEIHVQQQKQQSDMQRNPEAKHPSAGDPLRPPSHLLSSGSSLTRGHGDLPSSSTLLGPNPQHRSPFESGTPSHPGSFLSPNHLAAHSFQRPSPYSGLGFGGNSFGGLGNLASSVYGNREISLAGFTSPHEWSRLHRTPKSFPTPPVHWPGAEIEREMERERDRERDREREAERERERSREAANKEREQTKERERERESSHGGGERREDTRDRERHEAREREKERERELREREQKARDLKERHSPSGMREIRSSLDHRDLRPHDRTEHSTSLERRHSRSRSRSPIRNGPLASGSTDSALKRISPTKSDVRVKEERKDDIIIEECVDKRTEVRSDQSRPDVTRNDIIQKSHSRSELMAANPYSNFLHPSNSAISLLGPGQSQPHLPGLDRHTRPSFWNPFERSLDVNQHRLEIQREFDREREEMMKRLSANPLGVIGDIDKYRQQQELLFREHALREREGLIQMERERIADGERNKIPPPLRPSDPYLGLLPPNNSMYVPGSGSPVLNHNSHNNTGSKSNSPSSSVGCPPPLIPSIVGRSHSNSPLSGKVKPPSPVLNSTDTPAKDKPTANGHDSDAHSR